MKNIKDRTIRVENIPEGKLIYQDFQGFKYTVLTMLLTALTLYLLNVQFFLIIVSTLIVYIYLSDKYNIKFEVRENDFLYYLNKDNVKIYYYHEIINYKIEDDDHHKQLTIMTKDEKEHHFTIKDYKIISALDSVIGDKRVG